MTADFHTAEDLLHTRGFKVTPQRALLLRVLAAQSEHVDAEALYALAHAEDESVSLATVYRTLHLFTELGLADRRFVEPDHRREVYRLADSPEQHYLTCLRCGARVPIHTDLLDRMVRELVRRKGVSVTGACACFTGYCASCTESLRREGEI